VQKQNTATPGGHHVKFKYTHMH